MKLLVIVEPTATGFSAYAPDLAGCIATGTSREEVEREMRTAIALHLEEMRASGLKVSEAHSYATYFEVAA